jgi:hypothetical protein
MIAASKEFLAVDREEFLALARPLHHYLDKRGKDGDGYSEIYRALDDKIHQLDDEIKAEGKL